jgi:hypothetical protein
MKRTSIMVDEKTLYLLNRIAERQKSSTAAVIREALAEYVERNREPGGYHNPLLALVGLGESGEDDTSERVAEIMLEELGPQKSRGGPEIVSDKHNAR